MVTMTYVDLSKAVETQATPIRFSEKNIIQIGRDVSNDVVSNSPTVSRYHAQIERVGQRHRLTDLRSTNGTFVNDKRVEGDVWLQPSDVIRIGSFRFVMGEDELGQFDESRGLRVDALDLNKWVRKRSKYTQGYLAGFQAARVRGGRGSIGWRKIDPGGCDCWLSSSNPWCGAGQWSRISTPTSMWFKMRLGMFHTRYYPLRADGLPGIMLLPSAHATRSSKEERHQRIMQVLEDLDLVERKDTPISRLSGGQIRQSRWRGVTDEARFILPGRRTSGLDPGTETAFMHLMRRLADQGRTIVMITRSTKNVMLADKVVFLARGGYVAWFGPPEEALAYFDHYRSEPTTGA